MSNPKLNATLVLLLSSAFLMACTSGSEAAANHSGGTLPTASSLAAADPLEGEWHQTFSCVQNVRTFQRNLSDLKRWERRNLAEVMGNKDTSVKTLLVEFTPYFAWGPNSPRKNQPGLTADEIRPEAICTGAADRERTIRFLDGSLVYRDWDGTTEGPASYEFVNDRTFTVDDGGQDFGCCPSKPIDTFSFRIASDKLVITMIGQDDPWGGTLLEEAPWHGMN